MTLIDNKIRASFDHIYDHMHDNVKRWYAVIRIESRIQLSNIFPYRSSLGMT